MDAIFEYLETTNRQSDIDEFVDWIEDFLEYACRTRRNDLARRGM